MRAALPLLVLLLLALGALLWLGGSQEEGPVSSVTPRAALEPATPGTTATSGATAIVESPPALSAPAVRTAALSTAPLEEPAPAGLADGILGAPEPPGSELEARYAGLGRAELARRYELLRVELRRTIAAVHGENLDLGEHRTVTLPPGRRVEHTPGLSSETRGEALPGGGALWHVSEFDPKLHPRTANLQAEVDWLRRKLGLEDTGEK